MASAYDINRQPWNFLTHPKDFRSPKESERLDRWTLEEAWKIPEGERPIGYQYNLLLNCELGSSDVRRVFTLPDTWTFHDDEVLDEVR
jgi:hypothetical protein